ncbi:hypothetical protein GCM10010399_24210 [Dactylosporangium fulvum]
MNSSEQLTVYRGLTRILPNAHVGLRTMRPLGWSSHRAQPGCSWSEGAKPVGAQDTPLTRPPSTKIVVPVV